MAKITSPTFIATSDLEATAESIALQRVDEAGVVTRPEAIGTTWVEEEYSELESEQGPLWMASGLESARGAHVDAAGLVLAADEAARMLSGHTPILEAAEKRLTDTLKALAPFRRRRPNATKWHYAAKGSFLAGDIAGIAGAAITNGEIPALALIMATSAAVATVTAGLTGTEVRDARARALRERPFDELTTEQQAFWHLFTGTQRGWNLVKALLAVSVSVAALIACAIFALRTSIEGPLVGLVYGGIAASIAAASFIESYMYADEVADLIDNSETDYDGVLKRHGRLAGSDAWKTHAEHGAEADSITAEHRDRGEAARAHVRALKWGILRRNPGVVGHGPAAESTVIGQISRRSGVAK